MGKPTLTSFSLVLAYVIPRFKTCIDEPPFVTKEHSIVQSFRPLGIVIFQPKNEKKGLFQGRIFLDNLI